jgi:membrane associated rhomboid family serine protease
VTYVMFLLWLGLQCFGMVPQLAGFSNVSALAHLGGAGVGVLFWLVLRHRDRVQERI